MYNQFKIISGENDWYKTLAEDFFDICRPCLGAVSGTTDKFYMGLQPPFSGVSRDFEIRALVAFWPGISMIEDKGAKVQLSGAAHRTIKARNEWLSGVTTEVRARQELRGLAGELNALTGHASEILFTEMSGGTMPETVCKCASMYCQCGVQYR